MIFLLLLSSKVNSRSGSTIASGSPGNPGPVPTSRMSRPCSNGRATRLSRMCAVTMSSRLRIAVRLTLRFHFSSSSSSASNRDTASSSTGCASLLSCAFIDQVPLQEHYGGLLEYVLVFTFPVSVSFIQGVHVPNGIAFRPQRFDHLRGLGHGHAWIVLALHDKHRDRDALYIVQRADFLEKDPHRRITLIAILRTTLIPTIVLRILKKSDKVTNAHVIDDRLQSVAEMHRARQRHVSAIAGAVYGDAVGIEVGLRFDPVEQRAYVLDRVFAPDPVIQARVG